jgi:hypothetical protein
LPGQPFSESCVLLYLRRELGGEINLHCQLVFKPTATGTRTATLNVNDGANNSPQTIFLTGTGD